MNIAPVQTGELVESLLLLLLTMYNAMKKPPPLISSSSSFFKTIILDKDNPSEYKMEIITARQIT